MIKGIIIMKFKKKFLTSMQLMSCGIMKLKKPDITERFNGSGSLLQLADIIKADGGKNVLIVTSSSIIRLGLAEGFANRLSEYGIGCTVYSDLNGTVNIDTVENGLSAYESNNCDTITAIGGGTVIDCAKLIALRAANLGKNIKYMMDFTAVLKKAVPLYAAPTTVGSGSEISMLAFFEDEKGKITPVLSAEFVPRASALDPDLLITLSPDQTAYGAMDALTRAIESFTGTYSERFRNDTQNAPKSCRMIFENIMTAYTEPENKNAKLNLSKASYYASISFRRACGGYVHCLAHRLQELYGIPHGKANAILLPYILEEYMPAIKSDLSVLAYHCGLTENKETELENAFRFIEKIRDVNKAIGIPEYIDELQDTDIDLIVRRTQNDAKLTGCPKIFSDLELKNFLFNFSYKKNAG